MGGAPPGFGHNAPPPTYGYYYGGYSPQTYYDKGLKQGSINPPQSYSYAPPNYNYPPRNYIPTPPSNYYFPPQTYYAPSTPPNNNHPPSYVYSDDWEDC